MLIKDRFRGLNLETDPSELEPGESTICNDLYIKGKSLVSRDKLNLLDPSIISANIVATYLAENIHKSSAHLFYIDDTEVARFLIWSDGQWNQGGFEQVLTGLVNNNVATDEERELAVNSIRFLEWEDKLLVYRDDNVWIFTRTPLVGWVRLPNANVHGTVTAGASGNEPNREVFKKAEYIIELVNSSLGFRSCVFDTNIFHTFTFSPSQYKTINVLLTLDELPSNYDTINFYRKLTYADDTVDGFYYLVGSVTPTPSGISYGFSDEEAFLTTSIDDVVTFDTSRIINDIVQDLPIPQESLVAAEWYQQRVVWGTKSGKIFFSALNNPFVLPGEIQENLVSDSASYAITNIMNYFGMLVIFTAKGIYHLTGTIADLQADSNYQIYQAVPNLRCYSLPRLLLIEELIYFLIDDGLCFYNTRSIKHVTKNINSLWYSYNARQISGATLSYDNEKKLILVCIPEEQILVYHFGGQKQDLVTDEIGSWTTWQLQNAKTIGSVNRPGPDINSLERDKLSLGILAVIDNQLYIVHGENHNDMPDCHWQSHEIGGTDLSTKRWLQIKSNIEGTFVLAVNGRDMYSNTIQARYVHRGRIKERSNSIIIDVRNNGGGIKLINFDVTGERIGS